MSPSEPTLFKRAVLGLSCETYSAVALDVTARLAGSMRLDLLGIFVMDEMLEAVAGYPGARELLPGAHLWRSVDRERLMEEQRQFALGLQRLFAAKAQAENLASSFEIASGRMAEILASSSSRSDILVIAEPRETFASVTHTFARLLDAAIRSSASVLLIPRVVARHGGGIVALARTPADPSIATARSIAAASGDSVTVLDLSGPGASQEDTQRRQPDTLRALGELPGARLIVCTRSGVLAGPDEILDVFSHSRGTPLLILEPGTPNAAGTSQKAGNT